MEAGAREFDFAENLARFEEFFKRYYHKEILRVLRSYPEKKSLIVDFQDLDKYDISLADEILKNPSEMLPVAERAIGNIELPLDASPLSPPKINVRLENLPEDRNILIRDIRSDHVGSLLSVEGIVRKTTDVRPKLILGSFECQRCGHVMNIPQKDNKLKSPYLCESCETKGPFKLLVSESRFVNFQKIMIQEALERLRGGENPKQLTVHLEDDTTGKISPGDGVQIVGILRAVRGNRANKKHSRVFDIYLEGNSVKLVKLKFEEIELTKEDEECIQEMARDPLVYERIRDSIAPHIIGYPEIKEAIMYQLFSSPTLKLPDGGEIRGDSHIFILGEPSTGKSEILQYVAKTLAPRGIYTSGRGTSSAGLTATAVKDEFGEGGWSLEAGALVMADMGIACIDEFDKMEQGDRSAMHEAMEQQTVSIAKAGMLATFRARCAILAAANPKYGRFDQYRSISEQINLSPTILSRFDLIFFVEDDSKETEMIAKHILDSVVSPEQVSPQIEPEMLRKYIAYARQNIDPVLTDAAREKIEAFYVEMRGMSQGREDIPIPLTARQLWAIVRLARASARARLSGEVSLEDADRAMRLVNLSLKQAGWDMETGRIDIDKIMVGTTKSQRDKINIILNIIKELEKSYDMARKAEIVDMAEREGIQEKNVEQLLERLRRDGELYEPRPGHYKIV